MVVVAAAATVSVDEAALVLPVDAAGGVEEVNALTALPALAVSLSIEEAKGLLIVEMKRVE